MKKMFQKILSVILTVLMLLTVTPAFVLAAEPDAAIPAITLKKVSETQTEVIISVNLEENGFNCLDLQVGAAENLTLTKIEVNPTVGSNESNIANGMISVATVEGCVAPLEIAKYTYTKAFPDGVTAESFDLEITSCYIGTDANGTDLTDYVTVTNTIPAEHSHIAGDTWVETKEPTCSEYGTEVLYCTECGEIADTKNIEKAEHKNTVNEELAPTCTEAGYSKVYCNDCKAYVSETVLSATNHTATKLERKAASCTEDGYIKEICDCGETVSEEILPATDHNYVKDAKDATCTEDGYEQMICPACGDVQSTTILTKTDHDWLEWNTTKEPTYSANGIESRACDNCGIHEERSIPKLVAEIQGIAINKEEIAINFKQISRLYASVKPEEAAYSADIIWTSSDESVATVNENGEVYGVSLGTATITASTADGTITATCEVTVKYSIFQWIIVYLLFGWIWYI